MTTGMGIAHGIFSQPQHLIPSWPPILAKNKQLQGWFGPNDMCKWFQIASEALQSQNGFITKVCKGWDGNCTWIFHQNTPLSAKLTPKFDQKRTIWWLLWAKLHVCMIVDCCRSIPKAKIGSQTLIVKPGMGIVHGILSQPQHFLLSWPSIFGQKWAAPRLIWLKSHVRMIADYFKSTPKSTLVHKKGLQSLGWELGMFFFSKHMIQCQADHQIWPKMTNSGATLAQITCAHGCRQLQKHSKVKVGSQ